MLCLRAPVVPSLALVVLFCVASCSGSGCAAPAAPTALPASLQSPYTGYSSAKYRDDKMWLCRPDLPGDPCHADLSATEIHPDGSRTLVPHRPAADPQVDCFYVYPTVDLSLRVANHDNFADLTHQTRTTQAQAARFSEACALYVPLYRQVTIGTYVFGGARREQFMQTAFSDVKDAFLHYLGTYNHGRKIALIGHSQGAEMITRLARQVIESDPALRERLLVVMPIGGQVEVPRGQLVGGTFANLPLCSRPEELGCVVAFRTQAAGGEVSAGYAPHDAANETACVNPAAPGKRLSRAYYPVGERMEKMIHGIAGLTTPYVVYRDYYQASCVEGPKGYRYLSVAATHAPGEVREDPVDLHDRRLNGKLGTHILDMQFTQGDLIDLVARKAAVARETGGPSR